MEPGGMRIPGHASRYEYMLPIGYAPLSTCGYCKGNGKLMAYCAQTYSMSTGFYQALLDKCWRRSGSFLYRPNPRQCCCPHYTIRLDSREFKPSRAQRQAINRFNKYITGEAYTKEAARLYPKSRDQAKKRDNHFDLVERVHEAEYSRLQIPPEPAHKFEVTVEPNDFSEEKYLVYSNYQRIVHQDRPDKITKSGFKRFLCSSPLRRDTMVDADGRVRRLGSYHQCYRLDGQLVAVGVLDLLPTCVSSVYFMYHESIHQWAPGKLSAMYEIALAMEDGYRWWYPGYYIHDCPKMRYKIDFSPQSVLDPVSLQWEVLDKKVLSLFDQKKFVSPAEEKRFASGTTAHTTIPEHVVADVGATADSDTADIDEGQDTDSSKTDNEGDDESRALFSSDFPGIPSLSDLKALDLDHVKLKLRENFPLLEVSALSGWEGGYIEDFSSIKGIIAELVAATGPDLLDRLCVYFRV